MKTIGRLFASRRFALAAIFAAGGAFLLIDDYVPQWGLVANLERATITITRTCSRGDAPVHEREPWAQYQPTPLPELRERYPEYKDLTDQQLADQIYRKFYSDMPRDQFDPKVGLSVKRFVIVAPDGNKYMVTGPAGATSEEAIRYAQRALRLEGLRLDIVSQQETATWAWLPCTLVFPYRWIALAAALTVSAHLIVRVGRRT